MSHKICSVVMQLYIRRGDRGRGTIGQSHLQPEGYCFPLQIPTLVPLSQSYVCVESLVRIVQLPGNLRFSSRFSQKRSDFPDLLHFLHNCNYYLQIFVCTIS